MIGALLLLPLVAGVLALVIESDRLRRGLLVGTAATEFAFVLTAWNRKLSVNSQAWLDLDEMGLLFMAITSVLFLVVSIGTIGYLRADIATGGDSGRLSERVFTACLLFFFSTMAFVCMCRHFGLLWIGVESTTLASAPLVIFHRNNRSLEAMWKYLLICSVGIALALMGNLLLAVSAQFAPEGDNISLSLPELLCRAGELHPVWLRAAFIFLLVGYGTKMGLAPLHTWLPDAHSEAPSPVSSLLSGALLNCAFLAILRAYSVCAAAGEAVFAQDLLVVLGVVSLITAAIFILGQADYKRLLAYSSIEHVGLLALGVGIGGEATLGACFHAVNHSLVKGALFLTAGSIFAVRGTKHAPAICGLLRTQPLVAALWLAGLFAITGLPPFGIFFSEWMILRGAFVSGHYVLAIGCLALLAVIFLGMASVMLRMALGVSNAGQGPKLISRCSESAWIVAPPLCLLSLALICGMYMPGSLEDILRKVANSLNGALL